MSYTAGIRFDCAKTVACSSEDSFEEFTHLCKNLGITDHNNPILGSRESHVESTSVIQEPNPLVLVGTYTGEDDVIFLTSLEGIHTCHFKLLEREGGAEMKEEWMNEKGGRESGREGKRDIIRAHSNAIRVSTHLVQSLWHGAIELHVLYHVGPLALIGGDDANLVRLHSTSHQLGH